MIYACCDERRRDLVAATDWNGIDYLEVLDRDAPAGTLRQQTLLVHLLQSAATLTEDNIVIEGGERVTPIGILWARMASAVDAALLPGEDPTFFTGLPGAQNILAVRTDVAGDYSTYTLRLVRSELDLRPPVHFDPPLSAIDFSFKVECPTEFDCAAPAYCPTPTPDEPEIDYLAKDYASFRRAMLDHLALITPGWADRNIADVGVTLVELLAYVADHLSYRQDAIATEAYIGTARRRVSVRRHARLVDYGMHDGCNARAFVQIVVNPTANDTVTPIQVPRSSTLLSELPGRLGRLPSAQRDAVLRDNPEIFVTMHDLRVWVAHQQMRFHTWGDGACCLPKGAVRATLLGHFPNLTAGNVLVFEEVLGPLTGRPEDAMPAHRCAVRLTAVVAFDDTNDPLTDPITKDPITEIAWHADDALPFPVCVSARTDRDHGDVPVTDVSVARGNIILADHGWSIIAEPLGQVPAPKLFRSSPGTDPCSPPFREPVPPRFAPLLAHSDLTQAAPFDPAAPPASARAAMRWRLEDVEPQISLIGQVAGQSDTWTPARDLLASAPDATEFVPEVEADGSVRLRFGDDKRGMRPQSGTQFTATYRVGNGSAGNVGAEALRHIVSNDGRVLGARNPMPATGGIDPEGMETARRRAPNAFRTLARAVTPDDYATLAIRDDRIQRAAATFRWTGSWRTAFVTLDPIGGRLTDTLAEKMRNTLEPFRMAGGDLHIDAPRFVSIELNLTVCVSPDHFRSDVRAGLLDVLGNRRLPEGRRGLFHPDNLTFAQPVYVSAILAAAQSVPGVISAEVTRLARQGAPDGRALDSGRLELGRLEIARLDNDRDFPENGVLRLTIGGGK